MLTLAAIALTLTFGQASPPPTPDLAEQEIRQIVARQAGAWNAGDAAPTTCLSSNSGLRRSGTPSIY